MEPGWREGGEEDWTVWAGAWGCLVWERRSRGRGRERSWVEARWVIGVMESPG